MVQGWLHLHYDHCEEEGEGGMGVHRRAADEEVRGWTNTVLEFFNFEIAVHQYSHEIQNWVIFFTKPLLTGIFFSKDPLNNVSVDKHLNHVENPIFNNDVFDLVDAGRL